MLKRVLCCLTQDVPFTTCGEDTLGLEKLSVSTYPSKSIRR